MLHPCPVSIPSHWLSAWQTLRWAVTFEEMKSRLLRRLGTSYTGELAKPVHPKSTLQDSFFTSTVVYFLDCIVYTASAIPSQPRVETPLVIQAICKNVTIKTATPFMLRTIYYDPYFWRSKQRHNFSKAPFSLINFSAFAGLAEKIPSCWR